MKKRSRADRLYRLLLRLFPSDFRGDFGSEMAAVFRDERADASKAGVLRLARLWLRTIGGIARTAPREHADVLLTDARYGLRVMRRHPLTTAAAVLTIALGIGANTAMFTVVNAVFLQLPFEEPDRLVSILQEREQGFSAGITATQLRLWNERVDALDALAGYSMATPVLTGIGDPDRLRLECVSPSMFAMLGVPPSLGRTFLDAEDRAGAERVIVVSHSFWANRLGRGPQSLGSTIALDGKPVTVIGVMPKAFDGPRALRRIDGWIPLWPCIHDPEVATRPRITINVYGKLKRDVAAPLAEEQLSAAMEAPTLSERRPRVRLDPMVEQIYGDLREPLLALVGAAGFVLLIACANVASLLLSRTQARQRELAMRAALGCTRARVARQLLTESVLFALCGGAAGLLFAKWSLGGLLALMPGYIRRIDHVALDGYVLAACVALSMGAGLLFGLFPALYASRTDPGAALKEYAPGGTPGRGRMRSALIVAEIALSVALLVGAALLLQTFMRLRPVQPGFDPEDKIAATIALPRARYADRQTWFAFEERLRDRLRQRPGVEAVAAVSHLPLSGFIATADVQAAGQNGPSLTVNTSHVTTDYLNVMGIPIIQGRAFTTADDAAGGVAIVNERMAQRVWPGQSALGRQILFVDGSRQSTKTIIGIARDVRDSGRRLAAGAELYVPLADEPVATFRIVVKARISVERMAPAIRQEVAAIDPLLPVAGDVESVAAIVGRSVATWRFAASLLTTFAGMAVMLAAVGLFAVVGSWVAERTSEIGVRMALGAGRGRVLRLFLVRSAVLTALGIAAGLALAALTTRFLAGWLVETSPLDASAFVGAAAAMGTVSLLATYAAARRATSVDPLIALRR
jgi:putative ABC transport system permease protein